LALHPDASRPHGRSEDAGPLLRGSLGSSARARRSGRVCGRVRRGSAGIGGILARAGARARIAPLFLGTLPSPKRQGRGRVGGRVRQGWKVAAAEFGRSCGRVRGRLRVARQTARAGPLRGMPGRVSGCRGLGKGPGGCSGGAHSGTRVGRIPKPRLHHHQGLPFEEWRGRRLHIRMPQKRRGRGSDPLSGRDCRRSMSAIPDPGRPHRGPLKTTRAGKGRVSDGGW
jgi:hypothetical protein